jgi:putative ABC transport system permease protein
VNGWKLAISLARRELRAGVGGFRIFLACLALGVAAIAGIGSLAAAVVRGLEEDARVLMGGDVEFRLTHRAATPEMLAAFRAAGAVAATVDFRAMARANGKHTLVEIKAVDTAYPLYGAVQATPQQPLATLLAQRGDAWGALSDPTLLPRLGLQPGGRIQIGNATYEIAATIEREPDRGTDAFSFGPRLMVGAASLPATGLISEGALIRHKYRVKLPATVDAKAWLASINAQFPDAGWQARAFRDGAPGIQQFIDRLALFLTLVGLTSLLVGGLGVGNAVAGYMRRKTEVIATLKCLGAPGQLVFRVYLLQVMALAAVGIAIGLVVGIAAPPVVGQLFADKLPTAARYGVYPGPLALAALYGLLIALSFALWPLARAREVPAAGLFRDLVAPSHAGIRPKFGYLVVLALAVAALAGLAIATAPERKFAVWFVGGAAASLILFAGAGVLIRAAARGLGRELAGSFARRPWLRLALANLHRPGAPTVAVVLSFGLGLSVLAAVAQIHGNLSAQIMERLPVEAPAYFFIDIQPDQAREFDRVASAVPGVGEVKRVPSLRGRIASINGVPVDQANVAPEAQWAIRGDRGLTYAATPPDGTRIVAGKWWPRDYSGPPLVSFDARVAAGMGLKLGDKIGVNVLGREIEATIASLREIDWSTMSMNFTIIFAPGAIDGAPQTHIATAQATPAAEAPLIDAITNRFANVSAIRVKDALEAANRILGGIATAAGATASITLIAGVLVLGGAIAAGHRRRVYDAVILKVLGADRRNIMRAYLMEFAVLGLSAAAIAAVVGTGAAWGVVRFVMRADWIFLPGTLAGTTALSLAVTVIVGLSGTWAALGERPARVLRTE